MIKLHPDNDLDLSIIVLGSDILNFLKGQKKQVIIEDILNHFLQKDNRRTPILFMDTLVFLFSVGIIQQDGYKIGVKNQNDHTQLNLF